MHRLKFRNTPRPDGEIVTLLERALESAKNGHIQAIVVIAVSQLHEAEIVALGADLPTRSNALLGGLTQAVHLVLKYL